MIIMLYEDVTENKKAEIHGKSSPNESALIESQSNRSEQTTSRLSGITRLFINLLFKKNLADGKDITEERF